MIEPFQPHRTRKFTAEEVLRMVETGLLHDDEKLELIEGDLIVVSPQSPTHAFSTARIHRLLERLVGAGFHVRDHSPVKGTADSLPEPDLALVRGEVDAFRRAHPGATDTLLVVEVSVSTRAIDRRKSRVYAAAGYATYWLLDVDARRLEVRTGPRPDGEYTSTQILDDTAEVELPVAASKIAIRDLLP